VLPNGSPFFLFLFNIPHSSTAFFSGNESIRPFLLELPIIYLDSLCLFEMRYDHANVPPVLNTDICLNQYISYSCIYSAAPCESLISTGIRREPFHYDTCSKSSTQSFRRVLTGLVPLELLSFCPQPNLVPEEYSTSCSSLTFVIVYLPYS